MRSATLLVLGLLAAGVAVGAWSVVQLLDGRDVRTIGTADVQDDDPGVGSDLAPARGPQGVEVERVADRSSRARDRDAAELLAQIEALEAEVAPETDEAEAKAFDAFFDSATMYEPVRVEGPLTVAHFPDGQIHFRAEQRLFFGEWLRDGTWQVWHQNGQPHEEGGYSQGAEHGEWRWWYPNGNPMAHGRYDGGYREGPWSFYHENGRVSMQGQYEAGDGVGHWVHFDEHGTKRAEGDFVNGRPSGNWVAYDEDGRLSTERSGTYRNGIRRD